MPRRARGLFLRRHALSGALALAALSIGCGGGGDYYYIVEIKGAKDTVVIRFVHTCGDIKIGWDGSFGGQPDYRIELAIDHDAPGDCDEDPREVPFDVGPMKRSFRAEHPRPTPLGLRIPPYEEEQGAICLADLFQEEPFKGMRCK